MVWDEGIQTVVMLTNTQEKGKVGGVCGCGLCWCTCEVYWPHGEVGSSVVDVGVVCAGVTCVLYM